MPAGIAIGDPGNEQQDDPDDDTDDPQQGRHQKPKHDSQYDQQ